MRPYSQSDNEGEMPLRREEYIAVNKLKVSLPIHAFMEFSFDKPDNWDRMSKEEKHKYVISEDTDKEALGYLCHHCSKYLESELEVNEGVCNNHVLEFFEYDGEKE